MAGREERLKANEKGNFRCAFIRSFPWWGWVVGGLANIERNCVRGTSEEEFIRFGNWLHIGDDGKKGREMISSLCLGK